MDNPLRFFAKLRDPGVERNRELLLEDVLLIAIAAGLSEAESWNDIAEYGISKQEWFGTFLTLPGVAGAGTYRERTVPQDNRQNRARNPLLHHQPQAGCVAAQCGDPPALGHRKQTALGARRGLPRRPGPQTRRTCRAELFRS